MPRMAENKTWRAVEQEGDRVAEMAAMAVGAEEVPATAVEKAAALVESVATAVEAAVAHVAALEVAVADSMAELAVAGKAGNRRAAAAAEPMGRIRRQAPPAGLTVAVVTTLAVEALVTSMNDNIIYNVLDGVLLCERGGLLSVSALPAGMLGSTAHADAPHGNFWQHTAHSAAQC